MFRREKSNKELKSKKSKSPTELAEPKINEPEKVKTKLDKHVGAALGRTIKGEIKISVSKNKIVISDTGTVLSKPMVEMLNSEKVSVKSRVGFGTTVTIEF